MVLVSHSFPLSYGVNEAQDLEPLLVLSRSQSSIGTVSLWVFFIISGYLITQSFVRSPDPFRFLWARFLRIFPGLLVALLFCAVCLGPLVTSAPLASYFGNSDTFSFVWQQFALYGPTNSPLPGVFSHLPVPGRVNGSLWTLKYEFTLYLAVLGLGVIGLLRRSAVLAILLGALFMNWRWIGDAAWSGFTACFAAGALLYLMRDRVPLDWRIAAGCLGLLIASATTGGFRLAFATAGAYLVIYLASAPQMRLPNFGRYGDMSYGIYIYAYPFQQATVQLLGNHAKWYLVAAISLPVAMLFAFASWHFVERPSLDRKRALLFPKAQRSL